jgi:hypothetical protein
MNIIENYFFGIFLCIITMIYCGLLVIAQKLLSQKWPFHFFYEIILLGILIINRKNSIFLSNNNKTKFFEVYKFKALDSSAKEDVFKGTLLPAITQEKKLLEVINFIVVSVILVKNTAAKLSISSLLTFN